MIIDVKFKFTDMVFITIPQWDIRDVFPMQEYDFSFDPDEDSPSIPKDYRFPVGEMFGSKAIAHCPFKEDSNTQYDGPPVYGVHRIINKAMEKRNERILMWNDEEVIQNPMWGPPSMVVHQDSRLRRLDLKIRDAFIVTQNELKKIDPDTGEDYISTTRVWPAGKKVSKRWYDADGRWRNSQYEYLIREAMVEDGSL